jgi:hypothetical protein
MVHCESPLEWACCHYFEFDKLVRWYQEQPLAIDYVFRGEVHQYFVDFLVELIDGRKRLIEVKYSHEVNYDENVAKFTAARFYAEGHDMEFIVVTELDLHGIKFENMKHIYRHAFIRPDKELVLSVIESISQLNETNFETVITALTPVAKCHDPRSLFLWLIWRGKIVVDIAQKIEASTKVKVIHS